MGFKAVLWDFGGVITSSPFDSFNRYEAARGLPRNFIRGVNAVNHEDNAWAKFESSRCTVEEFDICSPLRPPPPVMKSVVAM